MHLDQRSADVAQFLRDTFAGVGQRVHPQGARGRRRAAAVRRPQGVDGVGGQRVHGDALRGQRFLQHQSGWDQRGKS